MKKLVVALCAMCLFTPALFAQSGSVDDKFGVDSLKTLQQASICLDYCKQKNYADAMNSFRYLFFYAPAYQQRTYINGELIIKDALRRTGNPAYIDTLMMLYDQRIKYFGKDPKYGEAYLLGKKGADLYQYRNNDPAAVKEAYNYFATSLEMGGATTHKSVLTNYFHSALDLMNKYNELQQADFVELYINLTEFIDKAMETMEDPTDYADAKSTIDNMFLDAGITDCKILTDVLTKKFNAAPTDVDNLKDISWLLRRSECLDGALYADVAEALYKADPSSDAAYSLAVLFLRRQDYDRVETYLNEAINKCEDEDTKSDYYITLAKVKIAKNQYSEVKRLCNLALRSKPSNGQAYILIAQAYAAYAPQYGSDDLDHKAVYWAVVDKLQTAKSVDKSCAEEADRLISIYSQNFPGSQEAFFNGITEGDKYEIGDWINETTTARLIKQK